jgi:hypothetical protein
MNDPVRVEWLMPELSTLDELRAQVIDMEDGCNAYTGAGADMSACRCVMCRPQGGRPRRPWIDEQTLRVELAMVLFNPQYGLYSYVGVNLFFNRGGSILKFVNIMSAWADLQSAPLHEQAVVYIAAILWLGALVYVFIGESREVISTIRSSKQRWYKALRNDYVGVWNVVDWVSFIVGSAVIVLFFMMNAETSKTNLLLAEMMRSSNSLPGGISREAYQAKNVEFFVAVQNMCGAERSFRSSLCVYPSIVMLRLFKSFAAQPRLALVTATLKSSATDMMHFFIVFLSVYTCMMVNSVLFFGQDLEEFCEFMRAMHTCFLAMFGDWDWDAMQEIGQEKAGIWFWLFMLIMVLILLNMLLAIIMEAYTKEKAKAESQDELWVQMADMWRRRQQFKQGKRVRLNDVMDAFDQVYKGDQKAMLSEDKQLSADYLLSTVPKLRPNQATRLLCKSLEKHQKDSKGDVSEQEVRDEIKSELQHLTNREEQISREVAFVRQVVSNYDRLEVPGDTEYEYYFGTRDDRDEVNVDVSVSDMVDQTSSEIGKLLVTHMAEIERRQDEFELQQDELHNLIAEIQLMIAQNAKCVQGLADAADIIGQEAFATLADS